MADGSTTSGDQRFPAVLTMRAASDASATKPQNRIHHLFTRRSLEAARNLARANRAPQVVWSQLLRSNLACCALTGGSDRRFGECDQLWRRPVRR
jgi:hypothetical protein